MIRTGRMMAAGVAAAAMLAACGVYAADDKGVDRSKLPVPGDIVAKAPASAWIEIAPQDLLVMDLPSLPTVTGSKSRRVVIQLMPAPFSTAWVSNIRKLASAHWWDGTAIVRVQDNYVTQWGDPDGEDKAKAKPLPEGLLPTSETDYTISAVSDGPFAIVPVAPDNKPYSLWSMAQLKDQGVQMRNVDSQATIYRIAKGWPYAASGNAMWPLHCYGAVGVGRNVSPDAGSGAELYTVIGHAPRQLDRNIAVVGRVISGMEWLSSLPRGTGNLGFYESPQERTMISSVRLASELPEQDRPRFEYLDSGNRAFADYVKLRANRHDSFYNVPAGAVDICNVPVPIRAVKK